VHVQVVHVSMCGDKPGEYSSLGSQHVYTIAQVPAECVAPGRLQNGDNENGMSCA
jgi:hypothetical protein